MFPPPPAWASSVEQLGGRAGRWKKGGGRRKGGREGGKEERREGRNEEERGEGKGMRVLHLY